MWYQLSLGASVTISLFNHLTLRPPICPGITARNGFPWSGRSISPFILYASIMPLLGSMTQFSFTDVP